MADVRESFPTLENGSGVGVPLTSSAEGDAAAGKVASTALTHKTSAGNLVHPTIVAESTAAAAQPAQPALVAKDASGNLKFLTVDAAGYLVTTTDGSFSNLSVESIVAGSATFVDVVTIGLTPGLIYRGIEWTVACFRDAIFEIQHVDDPSGTPNVVNITTILVGPGHFTSNGRMEWANFTAGATSPVLKIRAKNINSLSDFRASLATRQDTV